MRPWTPPRRKLKIPWEATPVQVRVLPSALRRARPRRDRVRARRRRDRVVDDQVDGHAYAPPMQPGRPEQGFEDPVLGGLRSEEHTSELQSQSNLVCRLLLEKKKKRTQYIIYTAM